MFEFNLREARARYYDSEYTKLHGPQFLKIEAHVLDALLHLQGRDVLLDLGCGTGRLLPLLAPKCRRVYAVDQSPASLSVLESRLRSTGITNVVTVPADLTKPLSLPERVSRVLCVQVLQHVPTSEWRRQLARNAASALLPGGFAVFEDEANGIVRKVRSKDEEVIAGGELYFHPFRPREYSELLVSAGLRPVATQGLGTLYWTRYRLASRVLSQADIILARVPGSCWCSKFLLAVAEPERSAA